MDDNMRRRKKDGARRMDKNPPFEGEVGHAAVSGSGHCAELPACRGPTGGGGDAPGEAFCSLEECGAGLRGALALGGHAAGTGLGGRQVILAALRAHVAALGISGAHV